MRMIPSLVARGLLAAMLLGGVSHAALAEMVFNRGNGAEPETIDVHRSSGVPESFIQADLYEGLLTPAANGEPVPGAAESWEISDDGLTYTFHLRENGKWSDGTPVTAEDFVFSMRRLVDPNLASDYAYFLDQVVNAKDIRQGKKPLEEMGVRAIDDRTLEIKLIAPTPYFLSSLVHHSTYPISKANFEQFGDEFVKAGNMVSNGAYMLAETVPQSHIKLVRNPNYWDAANVKIDTVMFYVTEDIDAELQRYQAGELDMTYELPSQQIPQLRATMPEQIHITPYFGTYFYAYNLTREPWKDSAELRHALSLAIDRDTLIKHVTQADQIPAYTFVPPGTDNFPEWTPEEATWTQAQRIEKAKELFAAAGYGPDKPLAVEITYNTSENHKKVAVAIAAMWKENLGVDVTLQNQEWGTFQETRDKKQFPDIARHGWIGDYNDANNFLELETAYIGEQNTSAYDNPKFDEMMVQASTETDLEKRGMLLQEAEKVMIQDLPIIPIYFYTTKHAVSPSVEGWVDNVQDYHLTRWLSISEG
jgi:oligopeptide transport system substrate-binding protein